LAVRTPCEILSEAGLRALAGQELQAWPKPAERPVFVAFVAEWCEVSLAAAPRIASLASSLDGRAELLHVDVDRAAFDTERLGVRSVPTLVLYARGREVARRVGLADEAELARFAAGALAEAPAAAGPACAPAGGPADDGSAAPGGAGSGDRK